MNSKTESRGERAQERCVFMLRWMQACERVRVRVRVLLVRAGRLFAQYKI